MSYYAIQGYSGFGDFGGFGLGAIDFNPSTVWSDWYDGSPQGSSNNAAGKRAAQALQAALIELGYGPLTVDGKWGKLSGQALQAFSQAAGVTTNCAEGVCYPTQDAIQQISRTLKAGDKPGPGPVVQMTKTDGGYVQTEVPGAAAKKTASMVTAGVAAVAVIAVGLIALAGKKKKPVHPAAAQHTATANRRRHRRAA